jgi:transcription initiation factor TFIIIB Brf1 subunit/transcription initiation factor TFIIB
MWWAEAMGWAASVGFFCKYFLCVSARIKLNSNGEKRTERDIADVANVTE